MSARTDLDDLWHSTPPSYQTFDPEELDATPDPAQRYLRHAIAPGTPLASAVRLQMRGEIKLNRWRAFEAEQVIRWDRGMIWAATVRMWGLPIRGFDRLVDGTGEMRWALLGLIPVVSESGPDIVRSNVGRMAAETVWLPSALCRDEVAWTGRDDSRAQAHFTKWGESAEPTFTTDERGRLQRVHLQRWGNPDEAGFRYASFGGMVGEEGTFEGYTIPTRLRVGWHLGEEGFASDGAFFRGVVTAARFR